MEAGRGSLGVGTRVSNPVGFDGEAPPPSPHTHVNNTTITKSNSLHFYMIYRSKVSSVSPLKVNCIIKLPTPF